MTSPRLRGAAVAALAMLTSSAFGGPPAGDDFNSGDLSNWTPIDPLAGTFGPTAFAPVDGAYRMTTAGLPPVPQFIGAGSVLSASLESPDSFAEGTMRARVRIHNDRTNFMLSNRSVTPGQDGFGFFLNNHEDSIGIVDAAAGGNIVAAPFTITEDVDYMLEATAIGTTITFAVWEAGPERPASPQLVIDSDLYTTGIMGAIVYNQSSGSGGIGGALDASFDDFTFTPAGTTLMDDFTGTLAAWAPNPLTRLEVDHSIVDGRAVISTKAIAGNLDQSLLVNIPSAVDPEAFSNGRLRASVNTVETNVILYIRGSLEEGTAYAATFRPTDGFLILSRVHSGGEQFLTTTFVPYGSGEDLFIEISAIGTELSVKIWGAGEDEPLEPTLSVHDATYAVGGIALAADGPAVISPPAPLHVEFGDVWFTPVDEPSNPADLNGDGIVNGADLGLLLGSWGRCAECPADLNGDGVVDGADLGLLLGAWS